MLSKALKSLLIQHGATLVGYADLEAFPAESRQNLPRGVSIAVALNRAVVQGMAQGPTPAYYEEYHRVNDRIDALCRIASDFLGQAGYAANPQSSSIRVGPDTPLSDLQTPMPHKTVATNAGLGWIGRTALLVTPQYGSALRLGSVLTDAPLDCDPPVTQSRCGTCHACCDACPGQAATGALWECGMPREHLLDARACQSGAIRTAQKAGLGSRAICGLCIYACPHTQRYLQEGER